MNTNEFIESAYITADIVRNSPSKHLNILNEAQGEETDFGHRLTCTVEIDGKEKKWRLNKDSICNMRNLGTDSKAWIGAKVKLNIVKIQGKEAVVGYPIMEKVDVENVR